MLSRIFQAAFDEELRKLAKMTATPNHWEGDSGVGEVVDLLIYRKPGLKILQETKEKAAGSMQGFVRGGKRPISASRLLEKEREGVKDKKAVITKLAKPGIKGQVLRSAAVLGTGAGLYHLGRKANDDRRLGKAVRLQQQGQ